MHTVLEVGDPIVEDQEHEPVEEEVHADREPDGEVELLVRHLGYNGERRGGGACCVFLLGRGPGPSPAPARRGGAFEKSRSASSNFTVRSSTISTVVPLASMASGPRESITTA